MTGKTRRQAEMVLVPADGVHLVGDLLVPDQVRGVVLFAHGSGSSRRSPRNRYLAGQLHRAGLATLLVDLLTAGEKESDGESGSPPFDVDLLAWRLESVAGWLAEDSRTRNAPVGYFGASTGAAAALVAAANQPDRVGAIVSRGGRPDLAGGALAAVRAPTLLVVGGNDDLVLRLNERAHQALRCEAKVAVVPGATHLFEEPGALEQASDLAALWFLGHLSPPAREAPNEVTTAGRAL